MYKTSILKQKKAMLLIVALVLMGASSFAQLAGGTYTIGTGKNYPTLKAAVAALGAGLTVADDGDVVLELTADYDPAAEFAAPNDNTAISIGAFTNASATNQVVIRPALGVTKTLTTSIDDSGVINLNGARYVTIDGRRGGTGGMENIGLTIINTLVTKTGGTNIGNTVATVKLLSNAVNNTITYTNIQGSVDNSLYFSGVVALGGGANNNTISYNDISGGAAGLAYNLIYNWNVNNTFRGNRLHRFRNHAIFFYQGTGLGTIVEENSIYTSTAAPGTSYGIYIFTNTGITIKNNFIGGQQPLCAGAPMPVNAIFYGIFTSNSSGTVNLAIQNNTIANISSTTGVLRGINVAATGTTIGTYNIEGNKIYQLRKTAGTSGSAGVYLTGAGTNIVTFNLVNNVISLTEAGAGEVIGIARSEGTAALFYSYFNTIHLDGTDGGTSTRANQVIFTGSNAGASITKNNIFSNSFSNGSYTGGSWGTYTNNIVAYASTNTANPANNTHTNPATGSVINNNIFFKYDPLGTLIGGPAPSNPSDFFASLTDLTIGAYQFAIEEAGVPVDGFTTDINGITRYTVAPSMGAYEYSRVLPVTISSFAAKLNNNKVQFNWSVGTETNVNRYEIERLQPNGGYLKVAEVAATAAASYVATDAQPLLGVNYYRLKSVDNDGTVGYYKELRNVRLATLGDKSVSVYPNPVVGNTIAVSLTNYPVGQYNYKIAGVTGNVVKQGQFDNSGNSSVVSLPVGLAKGIYILQIANGENTVQSKLIKN